MDKYLCIPEVLTLFSMVGTYCELEIYSMHKANCYVCEAVLMERGPAE